ncbi:MAG: sirohydrochlorin cobaltochelatase, partial [Deltaproteobacteria bacterium]|nr:sirohydrochlorin cobaltochelatase [Deltaproteobacteria bacterium]
FTHVVVQSLHTIPGEEYHNLMESARSFSGLPKGMKQVVIGDPLMSTTRDVERVADALLNSVPKSRTKNDAVIFLGHGTPHPANIYYPGLQFYLWKKDKNVFVGTVEEGLSSEYVVSELKERNIKKAYLMPLLSVAGDHAQNDMAGNEPDSWKSILTKAGITCEPVLKGTGESDEIADIWIDHLKNALSRIK